MGFYESSSLYYGSTPRMDNKKVIYDKKGVLCEIDSPDRGERLVKKVTTEEVLRWLHSKLSNNKDAEYKKDYYYSNMLDILGRSKNHDYGCLYSLVIDFIKNESNTIKQDSDKNLFVITWNSSSLDGFASASILYLPVITQNGTSWWEKN